jgi:hypothetical protein
MQGPPIWQRLAAAAAYLLPWTEGLGFGRTLFGLFPVLQWLSLPALPVARVQQAVPGGLGGLLLFLVLYLAVVRDPRVPYLIRFSVLQAILIDILLVLVRLARDWLLQPLLPIDFALDTLDTTVFLGVLVVVAFGIIQSLQGEEADIPSLSDAVRMRL